ncbi:uncharacterized protein LOC112045773 [Bicyclus anynana]|uniref:Uncharacterized protein LOC112045773 n=1 Tax=Bicyclus anynana TaxID=110368 RepID=A0ABM3LH42_BICAN|nr:uncharacterized protein LOC112045773 [Bicyclus anynana]
MSVKRKLLMFMSFMCLNISIVISAPLLQLLQPYPKIVMPPSQQNLQQQLLELQTMPQLYPIPQVVQNQLQPIIILLPDQPINTNFDMKINEHIEENELNIDSDKTKTKDGDEDSVVIDAEPIPILEEQKAFLIIPNGRLSIGDFISAIPFLPIEINVPDTVSWVYNGISSGISGIISIIGSRLPFQRPQENSSMENLNLKSIISELQLKNRNNARPLIMMPLGGLSGHISPSQY